MATKKAVKFDLAVAIDHVTGVILNNDASRREGVSDCQLAGHEDKRLVATNGTVKTISDLKTGKVVGELIRPVGAKRFEGKIDGVDSIGMFTSEYEFYIWTKEEAGKQGLDVKSKSKTLADRVKATKTRVEGYRAQQKVA